MSETPNNTIKNKPGPLSIVVIGGGAAGYFSAINCAENNPQANITILEATQRPLTKIKISGGGRCNVTHHCFEAKHLVEHYPRGKKELLGPFTQFQASDTVAWFKDRGVELKTEADGRMFATTNKSQTIIDCFQGLIESLGVSVLKGHKVTAIKKGSKSFEISCHKKESLIKADRILIATGSAPIGYKLAESLGHSIIEPMPSLFTFTIKDFTLKHLAGVALKECRLTLKVSHTSSKTKVYKQSGPLLFTHWGLSGPAVLKLSAFAARCLYKSGYSATLDIDLLPGLSKNELVEIILKKRTLMAKKLLLKNNLNVIPKSLWEALMKKLGYVETTTYSQLSHEDLQRITSQLKTFQLEVCAKGPFKEEFVTCGGVHLKEVHFKTMESKICPGLFFAGEILNIDGITGGFNFQNAWTGGYIAAKHMALTEA